MYKKIDDKLTCLFESLTEDEIVFILLNYNKSKGEYIT